MEELNQTFNEYLEAFKQMIVPDKRQEVIRAINEITAMFDMLSKEQGVEVSYLKSHEVLELKDGYESEDDYLEALLVYIENAKNALGTYLLNIVEEQKDVN